MNTIEKYIFDYFKTYSEETALMAISKLNKSEKEILRTLFGDNFRDKINKEGHYLEYNQFSSSILSKLENIIKQMMSGELRTLKEYLDCTKAELIAGLKLIDKSYQEFLLNHLNNNLDNYIFTFKFSDDEKALFSKIIEKLTEVITNMRIYQKELIKSKSSLSGGGNVSLKKAFVDPAHYANMDEYLEKATLYLTDIEYTTFNNFLNGIATPKELKYIAKLIDPKLKNIASILRKNQGLMPSTSRLRILQPRSIKDFFLAPDLEYLTEAIKLIPKHYRLIIEKLESNVPLAPDEKRTLSGPIINEINDRIVLVKKNNGIAPKVQRVVRISYTNDDLIRKAKSSLDYYYEKLAPKNTQTFEIYEYRTIADLIRHPLFQYLTTKMPLKESVIVFLAIWNDKDAKTIADFLDLQVENVEVIINNTRESFQRIIKDIDEGKESPMLKMLID